MKYILLAFLLLATTTAHADEWRTADTWREGVWQTLNLLDWGQTLYIAKHPNDCTYTRTSSGINYNCHELRESSSSWAIGEHPTVTGVNNYMLAGAIIHLGISYFLPEDYRIIFQHFTLGAKIEAVNNNFSANVKIDF